MVKTFSAIDGIGSLREVNDAQKLAFDAKVAVDPSLKESGEAGYLARWSEALVHVKKGDRVLDIGAGWPVTRVSDALFEREIEYHVVDIDERQVDSWCRELTLRGQNPANAKVSTNIELPFSENSMDFVFSSHCLEHSTDLSITFREIKRVLRKDGLIYFSVPFGFDDSDEHLLFLGVEEWLRVCEAAGFTVNGWTVGRTYASSYDLSILAKSNRHEVADVALQITQDYSKAGRTLLDHRNSAFQYTNESSDDLFTICREFVLTETANYLLALKHSWSGILKLTDSAGIEDWIDLYQRADHIAAIPIRHLQAPIRGQVVGKNPASSHDEAVIYGLLS